jgi:putative FmdB family regulatory protein
MPLYEYACDACGHRFEIIQKFSDGPPESCPKCGQGPVLRQQSSPAFQFKGTGWYVTDYAGKGKSSGEKSGDDAKPVEARSEGSSSDAKTETKTEKTTTETKKSDASAAASASKD